jgi:glucuronoarabinoxylan endo-1,4-beta-xylanase
MKRTRSPSTRLSLLWPLLSLFLGACSGSGKATTGVGGSGGAGSDASIPTDVTITIDTGTTHQTLVGFGAAAAYHPEYLADRQLDGDDIYNVLFSDLGLDILRLANWYQNQSTMGTTSSSPFTDGAAVRIVQSATAALGHPPLLLMSSWTPPGYLKNTGVTKGPMRGTLSQNAAGGYDYAQFSEWWVNALTAYAAQGIHPDYISLQNEPDFFIQRWETCLFGATESASSAGYGPALDAVYTAIQGSTLDKKPLMIGPEIAGTIGMADYVAAMNVGEIAAVAHHLYNGDGWTSLPEGGTDPNPDPDRAKSAMTSVVGAVANLQKPIFMTEYSPNQPAMMETARLIHNALTVEGVSAYIYWELFWPPPSNGIPTGLVTLENPAAAFSTPKGYTVNDLYYAFRHFSKWTDPGYIRVDATTSDALTKASAFVSPDDSVLTIVLINPDTTTPRVIHLDPGGFSFGSAAVYRSSGTGERTALVPLEDGNVVTMPAPSIATVTFNR